MPNNTGHTPFSPSINLDSETLDQEVLNSVISPTRRRSMVPGAISTERPKGSREIVDINDIMPETKKEETGVDIKESPQHEILKPGGIFDKYVEEKKKEYYERMKEEDTKRELEETESGEDNGSQEEVDKDEEEILSSIVDNSNITNIDVKEVSKEDEDNEIPFYQAAKENGFEDDYKYPDSYEDLPRDEDEEINNELEDEEVDNMIEENVKEDSKAVDIVVQTTDSINKNDSVYTSESVKNAIADNNIVTESYDRTVSSEKISFVYKAEDSIEDIEKELNNDSDLPSDDDRLEELRSQISEKIRPKAKVMNLEGWTIANKATASNKILETTVAAAGKWVLPATGICIQMREVSGQKIEYLRENMSDNGTAARNRLRVLYDHVVSPKPQSFEAWCKSIAFADYDHLFMPLYLAAFSDSNYMPQTCIMEKGKVPKVGTGCGKMFLSDNINIMKCVKFKDDESKRKFWNLYDSDRTNSAGLYASEVIPISKNFAIAFQEPTLYGVLLESAVYNREFREKYDNVVSIMPYIADIYWLDYKNQKLVRCSYTEFANNATKTAKSKVIRYSKIFDTFNTDEYTNVISIINSINEKFDWFTYQIPEMTCPECNRVIPAESTTAAALVFTRHRLGILANTSIN